MLQLVYRTYTDEVFVKDKLVKELSNEIVDYMSKHLDKTFFVGVYNDVQTQIVKTRMDRKIKQKLFTGTAEG